MIKRDILIKWHFSHPPEKVWECLTEPKLISQWLMKNDFKPIIGHRFNFYTKPIPQMGFDGIVYCEVLELIPNKKLVYTWKGGPRPGVIGLDSLLTWTLMPDGDGTRMILEHTGFSGWKNFVASIFMEKGWKKISRRMGQVLIDMK